MNLSAYRSIVFTWCFKRCYLMQIWCSCCLTDVENYSWILFQEWIFRNYSWILFLEWIFPIRIPFYIRNEDMIILWILFRWPILLCISAVCVCVNTIIEAMLTSIYCIWSIGAYVFEIDCIPSTLNNFVKLLKCP